MSETLTLVTLEIGPLWKMGLLHDLLEEHGVPSFVADSNLKSIDPFVTGALSFDARLQVPEDALDSARAALAEVRSEAKVLETPVEEAPLEALEEPVAPEPELAALAELGRRIRWATVLFWMHPFVLVYGVRYLRALRRTRARPAGHALTLAALVGVPLLWGSLCFAALVYGSHTTAPRAHPPSPGARLPAARRF